MNDHDISLTSKCQLVNPNMADSFACRNKGTMILSIVMAWLVPGLGHFLCGMRRQSVILAVCISVLLALAWLLGGIVVFCPNDVFYARLWADWGVGLTAFFSSVSRLVQQGDLYPREALGRGLSIARWMLLAASLMNVLACLDLAGWYLRKKRNDAQDSEDNESKEESC